MADPDKQDAQNPPWPPGPTATRTAMQNIIRSLRRVTDSREGAEQTEGAEHIGGALGTQQVQSMCENPWTSLGLRARSATDSGDSKPDNHGSPAGAADLAGGQDDGWSQYPKWESGFIATFDDGRDGCAPLISVGEVYGVVPQDK
jgi:hypothetical protein